MTNEYYPINILTHSGVIEMKYVVPGDYVYEYGTGNLLKVLEVTKPEKCIIHQITYNDNRIDFIGDNGSIFTGKSIVDMDSINRDTIFSEIVQYPVNFHKNVKSVIDPDPYLAGAFLIYGDYDDRYINLPCYMDGINDVLSNKHSISYVADSIIGKVYFKYTGDYKNRKITWERFFNNHKSMYVTSKDMRLPIIPSIYAKGSIKERIQFIRGVFDIGYSKKLFPNNIVGIVHKNVRRLKEVQKILWSLGILSIIEFDKFIDPINKNNYKLIVLGKYEGYPGFLYKIDEIEYLLSNNMVINNRFELSIESISYKNISGLKYNTGYMSNLVLEKPQALYLNDKYLPRVSI